MYRRRRAEWRNHQGLKTTAARSRPGNQARLHPSPRILSGRREVNCSRRCAKGIEKIKPKGACVQRQKLPLPQATSIPPLPQLVAQMCGRVSSQSQGTSHQCHIRQLHRHHHLLLHLLCLLVLRYQKRFNQGQ